jgi:hypothetical protein
MSAPSLLSGAGRMSDLGDARSAFDPKRTTGCALVQDVSRRALLLNNAAGDRR